MKDVINFLKKQELVKLLTICEKLTSLFENQIYHDNKICNVMTKHFYNGISMIVNFHGIIWYDHLEDFYKDCCDEQKRIIEQVLFEHL